jgi:hypothetical protein
MVKLTQPIENSRPPGPGTTFRGCLNRIKIQTRPITAFYLRNDVDGKIIASVRREQSIKLKPSYLLYDHGCALEAGKDSALWKIKYVL